MHIESIRDHCLAKKGTSESFPFDESTLVFKVMGKMFALCSLEKDPLAITLKSDPDMAVDLRAKYPQVQPGYHMNKQHWNTIELTSDLSDALIRSWIDESYRLIVDSLPRKSKAELGIE